MKERIDDGLTPQKRWALRHPEKFAAIKRANRLKNRAAELVRNRLWRARNPEKSRASAHQRYWRNPEAHRARARAWDATHPERRRATKKAWRLANPDRDHEAQRRSRQRRRAGINHSAALRRYRKKQSGGGHTLAQWIAKCELLGNVCIYCGEAKVLTRDHNVPIARGGTSNIENILPACHGCNVRKFTRTAREFIALRLAAA